MDKLVLLKSYLAPEVYNAVKAAAAMKGMSVQAFVAELLVHNLDVMHQLKPRKKEKI